MNFQSPQELFLNNYDVRNSKLIWNKQSPLYENTTKRMQNIILETTTNDQHNVWLGLKFKRQNRHYIFCNKGHQRRDEMNKIKKQIKWKGKQTIPMERRERHEKTIL